MFYRVRPEFVHGQADVLGCLRIQFQFGPLNENRIVTQLMEGSELGSNKVSNVCAVPIALDPLDMGCVATEISEIPVDREFQQTHRVGW
jgi:hypothetical protein